MARKMKPMKMPPGMGMDEPRKPPLGSGQRFKQLSNKLEKRGAKDPDALAAYIGRKKYGAPKMAQLSAKGRKK